MSKEVSNSQEKSTCNDSLNFGFDDCFTDVSNKDVSDLNTCLDYSHGHARSCEIFTNFLHSDIREAFTGKSLSKGSSCFCYNFMYNNLLVKRQSFVTFWFN